MRRLLETLLGLFDLARLGALSGFKFKSAYWRWRTHTAFGRGTPGKRELLRGVLEYARWMRRMRRMM